VSAIRAVAVSLAALLVAACGGTGGPAKLHFGMLDAPEGRRIQFPPEPEVPRYLYAGQLLGEANFRRDAPESQGPMTGLFELITGITSPEVERLVLQRPVAGMSDESGRIYVTDMSRQAVYVFDERAGELLVWERAQGLTRFVAPAGIARGRNGEVLVADAELGYVVRLDARGEPVGVIGAGVLKRPTGLATDSAQGMTFVADTQDHDVKVFDAAGRLQRRIGRRGDAPGEFNFPTHLALAGGELYVTDTMNSRVQVFDARSGEVKRRFGERGLYVGNLVRPKGIAVDNEANVYVVEGYYDHLLVFSASGEFLLPIGGTGSETGRFFLPHGVWVDARNRVFVADMFNGRVIVFQFLGGA